MAVASIGRPCYLHVVSSSDCSDERRGFSEVVGRRVSIALDAAFFSSTFNLFEGRS